jgi:hypothetical protein
MLWNQFFGFTLTSLGQNPNQDFTLLKADLIVQQQYNLGIIFGVRICLQDACRYLAWLRQMGKPEI